ncbi:MAG: hypothetical protein ACFCVC_19775 [Acidimicrobiia bacterium]
MRIIKLLSGLAGLLAVFVSVPVLVTGVALFSWAAANDTTTLPTVSLATVDRAVVAGDIDVFAGDREMFLPEIGDASIRATDDEALFVGVGPASAVAGYLASGEGAPDEQTFWVQSAGGTSAAVDWDIEPGRWTAVVMNADGSPGVDATVQASVPSGPLRLAGGILGVIGGGIAIVGALLVGAAWGGRRTNLHTGQGAAAPA